MMCYAGCLALSAVWTGLDGQARRVFYGQLDISLPEIRLGNDFLNKRLVRLRLVSRGWDPLAMMQVEYMNSEYRLCSLAGDARW